MVFLPGDHVLDTNITVADVTRLMMQGESSLGSMPTVICSGPVGFSFTSMVDFKIHSLAFIPLAAGILVIHPNMHCFLT